MSFRVGEKVVCVNAWLPFSAKVFRAIFRVPWLLREGEIYTIMRMNVVNGDRCVELVEVKNSKYLDYCFLSSRFRPLVERATDIGFAHEILRKATRKQDANA